MAPPWQLTDKGPEKTLWKSALPKRAVDDPNYQDEGKNNPTRNIDAVLVFDIAPRGDVGMNSNWQRLETSHSYEKRLTVLKCLHAKGLELTQSLSLDQTQWIIRISAPNVLLEETAERMGKKFQTKLFNSQEDTNRGWLNGYSEYRCEKKDKYHMAMTGWFTSVERQRLILYMIEKALGGDGDDYQKTIEAEKSGLFHLFPTHDPKDQANLNQYWVNAWRSSQPLDNVRDYYGEDIAMYFAFLGHYTSWLTPIAFFGLLVKIWQMKYGHSLNLVPAYCLVVVVWSTLFLEYWKRYQAELQLRWNVRNFESGEVDRIAFEGTKRVSPITGEDEKYFSDDERSWKYAVTRSILALSIMAVVAAAVGVVLFQYFAVHSGVFGKAGSIVSGIVNAIVIQIMNAVYSSVAVRMNDYENHQTATQYNDALIMKVFVFQFVNSYAAVTYMAFLAGRVRLFGIDLKCTENGCLADIHDLIGSTLALQILVGNCVEVIVPYVNYVMEENTRLAASEQRAEENKSRGGEATPLLGGLLNAINPYHDEDEALMAAMQAQTDEVPQYMSLHERECHKLIYESTFSDYNELVIQFGFVVLFSLALPIGSLLCLVNNFIEIRSDAFKLVNVYQRPFYRGAQDIGTWFDILRVVTVLGVLFNCGMMAFTSNIFLRNKWVSTANMGVVEMLVAVFIAEHAAFVLMAIFADLIPDEPTWIADEEVRLAEKTGKVLQTEDEKNHSKETERVFKQLKSLIDEHDIALLEDTRIRKWRRQPQYGSGALITSDPPEEGASANHHYDADAPAEWLAKSEQQEKKSAAQLKEKFDFHLY